MNHPKRSLNPLHLAGAVAAAAIGWTAWLLRPVPSEDKPPLSLAAPPRAKIEVRPAPTAASDEQEASLSLDQLLTLLKTQEGEPAAKAFVKEFKETPALEQAYEDFEEDQESADPQETVAEFAENLAKKAEFRQLVAKFAQDPGFRQVAIDLSRRPELNALITRTADRIAPSLAARTRRGAVGSRRGGRAGPRALAAGGEGGSTSYEEGESPPRGGAPSPSGGGRTDSAASSGAPPAGRQAEAKGQTLVDLTDPKLADLNPVGPEKTPPSPPSSISLCFSEAEKALPQCKRINDALGPGMSIWEACAKAGLFQWCQARCRAEPKLGCADDIPEYYATCVLAGVPRARCEKTCKARPELKCELPVMPEPGPGDPPVAKPAPISRRNPLASLCRKGDERLTPKALCDGLEAHASKLGFWGACVKIEFFNRCTALCQETKGLDCPKRPSLKEACRQAKFSAERCEEKCRAVPGCSDPTQCKAPGNMTDAWWCRKDGGRCCCRYKPTWKPGELDECYALQSP